MKKTDQYDRMINTPVSKLILSLSVPTVISMMVTNIYNLVDTAFVGRLGTSASGAVGIVFGFMSILQAIGFMFGQGCGSIIARRLGEKDDDSASRTASTGFFYSFFFGLVATILCLIFLDPMVIALGSTETIAPFAKEYVFYLLLTAPFMVSTFTLNNILRYEGKAYLGMIGLMAGAVLNIGGDMLFMFVFNMGIKGAGLSTAISQVVSFMILLSEFVRGRSECKLSLGLVSLKPVYLFDICTTGLPSLLRQGLSSITTIVLNMEASVYGDAAVAAMSIVSRIFFFIFAVAIGIGQGFQPVSGYNYGAKRFDRVKEGYRFTMFFSELLMLILGTIVFIKADYFVQLLRNDPEVILIGTRALRLHCLGMVVLPFCMATEMLMQSTGQRLFASILSALRGGLIFVPVLILLARFRGLQGIQEAQPLSFLIACIPSWFFGYNFFKRINSEQ